MGTALPKNTDRKLVVVGGGAAGLMAAYAAAKRGLSVTILERNARMGRKLLITGKGRCNITNNCSVPDFIANVPQNGRFLFGAVSSFTPQDMMAFLEESGLPVKTERGNRVFPCSDKARDVVDTLVGAVRRAGCRFVTGRAEDLLLAEGACRGVRLEGGEELEADAVIVCTGGLSYPLTGSTGDGYRLAEQAGHTVIPPRPSLVPLVCREEWCREAQGLSLRNVALRVVDTRRDKTVTEDFGEMLFTHFGVSGPMALSASAHMREMEPGRYRLLIDLKPALSPEQLDARLVRDFRENRNRDFSNSLGALLPRSLCPVVVALSGIRPQEKCNAITKEQRRSLAGLLKALPLTVEGFRPVEEAIVTSGGVKVSELNAKTMESKKAKGLYFAGEVLDVDAYTGGFNLQIAFSTGVAAGRHACE
ncbi:MAG TPA: NAD(P)/FAD-dependent oxidoreductase [Firmicutes bacterium]|nr:NAD(P)/FAD-dependent oxidoreductase [Bacillota bacterium]